MTLIWSLTDKDDDSKQNNITDQCSVTVISIG